MPSVATIISCLWLIAVASISNAEKIGTTEETAESASVKTAFARHAIEISDLLRMFTTLINKADQEEGRELGLSEITKAIPPHLESASLEELFDRFERAAQSFRTRFLKYLKTTETPYISVTPSVSTVVELSKEEEKSKLVYEHENVAEIDSLPDSEIEVDHQLGIDNDSSSKRTTLAFLVSNSEVSDTELEPESSTLPTVPDVGDSDSSSEKSSIAFILTNEEVSDSEMETDYSASAVVSDASDNDSYRDKTALAYILSNVEELDQERETSSTVDKISDRDIILTLVPIAHESSESFMEESTTASSLDADFKTPAAQFQTEVTFDHEADAVLNGKSLSSPTRSKYTNGVATLILESTEGGGTETLFSTYDDESDAVTATPFKATDNASEEYTLMTFSTTENGDFDGETAEIDSTIKDYSDYEIGKMSSMYDSEEPSEVVSTAEDSDEEPSEVFSTAEDSDEEPSEVFSTAEDSDEEPSEVFSSAEDSDEEPNEVFSTAEDSGEETSEVVSTSDDSYEEHSGVVSTSDDSDEEHRGVVSTTEDSDEETSGISTTEDFDEETSGISTTDDSELETSEVSTTEDSDEETSGIVSTTEDSDEETSGIVSTTDDSDGEVIEIVSAADDSDGETDEDVSTTDNSDEETSESSPTEKYSDETMKIPSTAEENDALDKRILSVDEARELIKILREVAKKYNTEESLKFEDARFSEKLSNSEIYTKLVSKASEPSIEYVRDSVSSANGKTVKGRFSSKAPHSRKNSKIMDNPEEFLNRIGLIHDRPVYSQLDVIGVPGENYPNYENIPATSFTCESKDIPGLYADLETRCQVFHVCWPHRMESYLCPVGSTFHQEISSCDYWYNSTCSLSPDYYDVNLHLRDYVAPVEERLHEGIDEKDLYPYSLKSDLSHPFFKEMKFLPFMYEITNYSVKGRGIKSGREIDYNETVRIEFDQNSTLPTLEELEHQETTDDMVDSVKDRFRELLRSFVESQKSKDAGSSDEDSDEDSLLHKIKLQERKYIFQKMSKSKLGRSGILPEERTEEALEAETSPPKSAENQGTVHKTIHSKTGGKEQIAPAIVFKVLETAENVVAKGILPMTRDLLAANYIKLHKKKKL